MLRRLAAFAPQGYVAIRSRNTFSIGKPEFRSDFKPKPKCLSTRSFFAGCHHYGSGMGRFISPDPTFESAISSDPQTWNRYTYALNAPLTIIDPNGELWQQNLNGGWDWGTTCNIEQTCVTQIAQQESENVVVYGPSSASDKQTFTPDKSGYVNVADIAKTDGAYLN